jgi:hypothetical protein
MHAGHRMWVTGAQHKSKRPAEASLPLDRASAKQASQPANSAKPHQENKASHVCGFTSPVTRKPFDP